MKTKKIIEKTLTINKKLKEKFGEVNTPEKIITDMINTLPNEVWENPNLKWFDPCAGSGNFFLVILDRLMDGLKNKISNEKNRETHILNNMLYMNEINKDSIIKLKKNFDKKINITNYDFLNYDFNKDKLKYDIIVGNPPYNLDGTKTSGKKNIYVFFAVKSLQLLKQNGYLLFIHPPGYRIDNHIIKGTNINLNNIYTSYDIRYIKMFNIKESNKYFNISINVDYILIKKSKNNNNKTEILDTYNKKNIITINQNDFIPNFGFKLLNKLKYLTNKYGNIKVYHSSELHADNILSDGTKLKHNLGTFKNIHLIIQKGKRIYNSKKKHTYYNNKKIFINALGVNYIYYDSKGEYGATEQQLLIIEPSNIYIEFFMSNLFQFIAKSTKITGNNLSRNLYKFLPDFNKMKNLNNITDIKKILNITNEEADFINQFKNNVFTDMDIYSK